MNWPMVFITLFNNVRHWAGVSSPFHPYHSSGSSVVTPAPVKSDSNRKTLLGQKNPTTLLKNKKNKMYQWISLFCSSGAHKSHFPWEENARIRGAGLRSRSPCQHKAKHVSYPCIFTSTWKITVNTVHSGTKQEKVSLVVEKLSSLITSALLALEHIYFLAFSDLWYQ